MAGVDLGAQLLKFKYWLCNLLFLTLCELVNLSVL